MNDGRDEGILNTFSTIKMDESLLLASGSWGEVRRVEHEGILRAAKRLLIKPTDISVFLQDCLLYSKLVHKNILPVLGICNCDQSGVPAIVMELMDSNLAAKLQQYQNMPIHLKLSVLQDVSEGLCYLHTYNPPIVHGNLHSKNIFLTSNLVAKVGDFIPSSVPRQVGGPFAPQHVYGNCAPSLDVFAFGCVICHVITQQLPMPSGITGTFSEIQLRQQYIDQIDLEPLKQLVMISLENKSENRPPISLVCERIISVRSSEFDVPGNLCYCTSTEKASGEPDYAVCLEVLLIGPAGIGKSSLASTLLGDPFVEKTKTTIGIDVCTRIIENWTGHSTIPRDKTDQNILLPFVEKQTAFPPHFEVKLQRPVDIVSAPLRISCQDFAGQMQYHSSYPIFIPKSAISIVTFDASLIEFYSIETTHFCMSACQVAHSLKEDKNDVFPLLPIILLAGIKIDKLHSDLKIARKIAKAHFLPLFRKEFGNKPYTQHLAGINEGIETALEKSVFFISNKIQDEEVQRLRYTLIQFAPQLTKNYSVMYHQIKHVLPKCKMQVISLSNMISMIKSTKISVSESGTEFENILNYLHNERAILRFSQVESLKDIVIPNPHWLAKLFGYILTTYPHNVLEPGFMRSWKQLELTGILHENLLRHILAKYHFDFPSAPCINYEQLRDILLHLHLLVCVTNKTQTCFSNDTRSGDVFIVPSLIPSDVNQSIALIEQKKTVIRYVFQDDIAPPFILNQVIAGCISRNFDRKQTVRLVIQ